MQMSASFDPLPDASTVDRARIYARIAIEDIARIARNGREHNNERLTGDLPMFAKINHLAICTTNYATNARFYQALFGMKAANTQRPRARPRSATARSD